MSTHVHLWCKSHYSFLEGASSPQELVETAKELGHAAIAITDRDGVYGLVRAHVAARAAGMPLILGAEVTLDDESTLPLLVRTHEGYRNLCHLISKGRLRSPKGQSRVTWGELLSHAKGLTALWGGTQSRLTQEDLPPALIHTMKDAFGEHLHAFVTRHHLPDETRQEQILRAYAVRFDLPLVGGTEVLYHAPNRRDLQDILRCIRARKTIFEAGATTRPNDRFGLLPHDAFQALFADEPALVEATLAIAERCAFSFDEIRYVYPAEDAPEGMTPNAWLRQLTSEGAHRRYPEGVPPRIQAQIERELQLIEELDYGGYFLTMKEIVDFCVRNQILCQGRGSAANSAVCWCLGITAVDPAQMELLFERFLSRERAEPPDIDLDIAHQRREEVIQYMYTRYGRDRAAMVANFIRYRPRSAFRDVATAFGLPQTTIQRVSKLLSHTRRLSMETLQAAGLPAHPHTEHILRLSNELLDAPRHLSIHPGGFIIGSGAIHDLVPIENATMEQRTVIQWDKYDVEDLGLFKVDLLGLGALTQLDSAFALLRKHYAKDVSMATIPRDDPATWAMLQRGDTVGVFQIESRAQMSMLPRLRPKEFYDLVIQISIVRPGPITGGMVHPYLRRRNHEEPVLYPHPSLEPVLRRTLGVPLFQEQVMKLTMVAADYTPGEADQLRRDMGAWRSSGRIDAHRDRLISRMMEKGISEDFATRVFEQIRGFGEYGFPESHAASFAHIAWATSWLRANYPEAFTVALLNAQPMGFYSNSTILNDARHHGQVIRPLDVQWSEWESTLEPLATGAAMSPTQSAIRLGFHHVQGFSERRVRALLHARQQAPFLSLTDALTRAQLSESDALLLAKAGAFDGFTPHRREVIWAIRHHMRASPLPLLESLGEDPRNDQPEQPFPELTALEQLRWDYEGLQTSAQAHILEPWRDELRAQGLPDAKDVRELRDGARVRYAGLVICRQRPGTAGGVVFITLEDESGIVNLIVWRDVWDRYALFLKTHSLIGVTGRLQIQHDVIHVIAEKFWEPKLENPTPSLRSRDFH